MKAKDYETAVGHFQMAISIVEDSNILRKLGEAFEKLGDVTQAELYYTRAIRRNLRHPSAYVELIGMLIDRERFGEAASFLKAADLRRSQHPVLEQYRSILSQSQQSKQVPLVEKSGGNTAEL